MEQILTDILEKIKPTDSKKKELEKTREKLIKKAKDTILKTNTKAEAKIFGSTARNTWLSGEKDIDLFLIFPENTPREELEKKGLKIGKKISEGEGREQYAEHPYVNTKIDGFDIDIVPCYEIDDPTQIKSAVDRTPHHQDYINSWLTPETSDQVLLLKKFMKGIGTYGSELKINGFSGYLCELLTIHYGSFEKVIKSASDWGEKTLINRTQEHEDEDLKKMFQDHPLIFVDPVDPSRNVAAAVSKKNYAKFIRATEQFLKKPKKEFFTPNEPSFSIEKLEELIEDRKTKLFMTNFEIPFDLVPDIIYPQLRKTRKTLTRKLEENNFKILRSDIWSNEDIGVILLELKVSKLPKIRKHEGPPLDVDAGPFIDKYNNSSEKYAGPYLNEDGRLVVEISRNKTEAKQVIHKALKTGEGFGKHIKKSINQEGYKLAEDQEIVKEAESLGIEKFLGKYLTKCLPWQR